MGTLKFVPPRVPIADDQGCVTREWYLFLQGVFNRVGGPTGPSTIDVTASAFEDAGSGETNAALFSLERTISQAAELSTLRDQVAQLRKDLDSLRQGAPVL